MVGRDHHYSPGALANPELPKRLSDRDPLSDFDPALLGPIANIKDAEWAM